MTAKPVAVVVGGGISGALSAKALADRGFHVRLFEKYPHPSTVFSPTDISYNISLGPRGQDALRKLGVSKIKKGVFTKYIARHVKQSVKVLQRARPDLSVASHNLAFSILRNAEDAGVEMNFEHTLKDVDFDNKVAEFSKIYNESMKVKYDLLVAADGSKSTVRQKLVEDSSIELKVHVVEDAMEYQCVILPHWRDIICHQVLYTTKLKSVPPETVHTWADKASNFLCLSSPFGDKTLMTMICPVGTLDGL
eukprot:CAMPEP_0113320124 /NCGR_PEP_ID=MMETSP0010_2-20120614/14049_1 /TAXON_ID=216773 ORGANISM="Corethron hystrix, Strain 308" /NCGR_SAMPLE_ID=MMETSP0010_2 /ASSEMBLY_ACC=CAM_ASM_000155 /LENGTH=250 /DNA_ID=CAMNT_0000177825 /DNA_START=191 /DNA_END=940 /DNA_ORIENTATION=- /assembly_acc=CAM_ASM_000155